MRLTYPVNEPLNANTPRTKEIRYLNLLSSPDKYGHHHASTLHTFHTDTAEDIKHDSPTGVEVMQKR